MTFPALQRAFAHSRSARAKRAGNGPRRTLRSRQLRCEPLEDRRMLSVSYPSFPNSDGLNLLGRADTVVDDEYRPVLRLTPAEQGNPGGAWFEEQQFVSIDFETTFDFRMSDGSDAGDGTDGSDGFGFVIQNDNVNALGGGAGGIGYNRMLNSLVVEFDTWRNSENDDPSKSHISVHTNGTGPNNPDEAYSLGSFDTLGGLGYLLDDAQVHTARITYVPGTMDIFLDGSVNPVLTVSVDLAETLDLDGGRAWVGFVAATGGGWQNHDILNWQYDSLADTTPVVAVSSVDQLEGDSGQTLFEFPVSVTRPDATGVLTAQVTYATANGTAVVGSDYVPSSGTLTFNLANGQAEATQTVTVQVNGDTAEEGHEDFFVTLSDPVGAVIADGRSQGRILNDDTSISIHDVTVTEGDDTPRFIDAFVTEGLGGLDQPRGLVYGPNGNLYVCSAANDVVLRYDGATAAFIDTFVTPGLGGLDRPVSPVFYHGDIYVGSSNTDSIFRYDGSTGALISEFVTPSSGGLDQPALLLFHNGDLYVSSLRTDEVLRYQGPDGLLPGALIEKFIWDDPATTTVDESGGVDGLGGMLFHSDGYFYLGGFNSDNVLRYKADGTFVDEFVPAGAGGLDGPTDFAIRDGELLVGSYYSNSVLRFEPATGNVIGDYVPAGSGGLEIPRDLELDSAGNLLVTSVGTDEVLRYGPSSHSLFTVTLSMPSALIVTANFATADGTATAGIDYTATSGTVVFGPGVTTRTIIVPTIDDTIAELDEAFFVNISNPSGGTIADSWGVAIIGDDNDAVTLGDLNGDRQVNGLDADLFVATLLDNTYDIAADMNQDGAVNGLDVDPFVAAVVGAGGVAGADMFTLSENDLGADIEQPGVISGAASVLPSVERMGSRAPETHRHVHGLHAGDDHRPRTDHRTVERLLGRGLRFDRDRHRVPADETIEHTHQQHGVLGAWQATVDCALGDRTNWIT